MNTTLAFGFAVACLAICFIIMVILNWRQSDQIKNLEKRVKKIEDDRQESKGSVLYTRPLPVQPRNSPRQAVDGGELRRPRRVDRGGKP